jgi:hypothetical protein
MRLALVIALALALLAPIGASAEQPKSRNSRCDWIARQLVRADAMKVRAAQVDDRLGVDRFEKRITYLEDQFDEKCPVQAAQQKSAQEWTSMFKTAASAALSYLTLGAY